MMIKIMNEMKSSLMMMKIINEIHFTFDIRFLVGFYTFGLTREQESVLE